MELRASLTLAASSFYFLVSFALWTLVGALGPYIAEELRLNPAQKGLLVALPILSGSLLRIPLGLLSDSLREKSLGLGMMISLFLPLILCWQSSGLWPLIIGGSMLGLGGSSFAVALPLASKWYGPDRQGLITGIVAAGNVGTALANLLAPSLAADFGWRTVFALAMLPLAAALIAFWIMAKDPRPAPAPPHTKMISLLEEPLLWRLCFFYTVSFGGFLGLSHSMPSFLRDQYSVDPLACGHLTALIALIGTLFRPIGGFLADKIGGPPLLAPLLAAIGLSYILVGQLPGLELMIGLLTLMTIFLGMGSGVVFQLLTHRFPSHIGAATGIVGALGGLGGFFLPIFLGSAKQVSGSFGAGFLALGLVAAAAAISARNLVAEGGKL